MNEIHPPQQAQPQPGSQPVPLAVWGATDKGRQREGNEDAIYPHSGSDTFPFKPGPQHLAQRGQLLIVADGVGGAQAGREASHWATRVAVERYYDTTGPDPGADLRTTIEVANASLYQYLQSTGTREAGCTMAAAVIHGNTLYVANVGDSRVYLLRNRQIAQLTRDHTLTQQKIDQGIIQPEQAETDPNRNVLTRSLGSRPEVQADLFPPLQLAPGDVVLLCSDGLTDMLEDAEVARLAGSGSPKRAAQRLIAAANRSGGFDNISVVVAQVAGKKPSAGSSGLLDPIRRMSRRQQTILLVGAALVAAALCAMAALGWQMYSRQRTTPTPATDATATSAVAPTTPAVAPTTEQPAEPSPAGRPTSTPAPTFTPTHTPLSPTSTPSPTPTMTPEPTQEPPPTQSPGGGEQPPPPPPPPPPPTPTEKPPPPPPGGES